MPGKGEVFTPLNRRHGRIRPHAVRMEHLSLGSELLKGGVVETGVLFSEIKATNARAKAVLNPGPAAGHLKIIKIAAGSKDVSFRPAGSSRMVIGPGDVWFGVWNGAAWLTIHCSVNPPAEPTQQESPLGA